MTLSSLLTHPHSHTNIEICYVLTKFRMIASRCVLHLSSIYATSECNVAENQLGIFYKKFSFILLTLFFSAVQYMFAFVMPFN